MYSSPYIPLNNTQNTTLIYPSMFYCLDYRDFYVSYLALLFIVIPP